MIPHWLTHQETLGIIHFRAKKDYIRKKENKNIKIQKTLKDINIKLNYEIT